MPTREEIQNFSMMIEVMSKELNESILDTISHHCDKTGLEMEYISGLLSASIKGKILEEAQDLNMVRRSSKLPI